MISYNIILIHSIYYIVVLLFHWNKYMHIFLIFYLLFHLFKFNLFSYLILYVLHYCQRLRCFSFRVYSFHFLFFSAQFEFLIWFWFIATHKVTASLCDVSQKEMIATHFFFSAGNFNLIIWILQILILQTHSIYPASASTLWCQGPHRGP